MSKLFLSIVVKNKNRNNMKNIEKTKMLWVLGICFLLLTGCINTDEIRLQQLLAKKIENIEYPARIGDGVIVEKAYLKNKVIYYLITLDDNIYPELSEFAKLRHRYINIENLGSMLDAEDMKNVRSIFTKSIIEYRYIYNKKSTGEEMCTLSITAQDILKGNSLKDKNELFMTAFKYFSDTEFPIDFEPEKWEGLLMNKNNKLIQIKVNSTEPLCEEVKIDIAYQLSDVIDYVVEMSNLDRNIIDVRFECLYYNNLKFVDSFDIEMKNEL